MYTISAAHTLGQEQERGSSTPGKLADLIVLAENPYEADVDHLPDIAVDSVFVGGGLRVAVLVGVGAAGKVKRATCGSWSLAWSANSEFTCTTSSVYSTLLKICGLTRMWSMACELPSNT